MNSIKTKLTIVLFLMALVPLMTLGFITYNQTTDIFTKTIQDYLFTIVRSKDAALENYIDSTEQLGQSLAKTDEVQQYVALLNKDMTTDEMDLFTDLTKRVDNLLYSVQETHWGKYHHVFLISNMRKIVISPNHGDDEKGMPSYHMNEDTSNNPWATQSLAEGITTVSDYSSWLESDHTHQMLFFPVKNASGITQAVIGFELQIPYEQEILTENFELGETGSVFLTTTEGIPIVYKGIENQSRLNTLGILEAQMEGSSFGLRSNAEGVKVIDVYLKNDKHPWILVAEIEAQEAFSSLRSIQTTMLIGFVATIALITILSVLLSNLIVNPIKRLTKQMEEVSLGNVDIKIDNMGRNDEIGQLVKAFNRIVKSLKIAMKGYKKS